MNEIKFKVAFQHEFKKHLKKIIKSGQYNIADFDLVYELLIRDIPLPARYNDHPLINRKPERECHIKPDWLLIYKFDADFIKFIDTGSHSSLFD